MIWKFIFPSLFAMFLLSCGPSDEEKKQAIAAFIEEDYKYSDTTLYYILDTTSLVISFPSKPEYEKWDLEAWLVNRSTGVDIYLGNHTKYVSNNQIVFDNFQLSADSLEHFKAQLFACPLSEKSIVLSKPFGNIKALWNEDKFEKFKLKPDDTWRGFYFIRFKMDELDEMSPELAEHCLQVMASVYNFDTGSLK